MHDKILVKMPSSNHIAGFFDHQNLWKECTIMFDFLHGDIYIRKVVSFEATAFGQVCPGRSKNAQTYVTCK